MTTAAIGEFLQTIQAFKDTPMNLRDPSEFVAYLVEGIESPNPDTAAAALVVGIPVVAQQLQYGGVNEISHLYTAVRKAKRHHDRDIGKMADYAFQRLTFQTR
jgi:hypothetical protein